MALLVSPFRCCYRLSLPIKSQLFFPQKDVYASSDLSVVMPKYKLPEKEHDLCHAYQVVHDELMLDGNARQNLATFAQTWVDEYVHKLMDENIARNMIDKDEYPKTAEI